MACCARERASSALTTRNSWRVWLASSVAAASSMRERRRSFLCSACWRPQQASSVILCIFDKLLLRRICRH